MSKKYERYELEAWKLLNKVVDNATEYAAIIEEIADTDLAEEFFTEVVEKAMLARQLLEKEVKQ